MRSRGKREIELVAKPFDNPRYPIYANRVDINRVATAEDWFVATLTVNFGVSVSFFSDDREEKEALAREHFSKGDYLVTGTELLAYGSSLTSDNIFYTVELKDFIPAGWEFEITRVGNSLNRIGINVFKPGMAGELDGVHILDEKDLLTFGTVPCNDVYQDRWLNDSTKCQRPEWHLGNHQSIDKGYVYDWKEGEGASRSPYLMYGFTCRCPHCDHVSAGNKSGLSLCFTCEHWLSLEKRKDKDSFVIGGRHYRPGAGGFGGRKFKIRRDDESIWEGELFTQGEVPEWMRDRFPDNAVFVTEKRSAGLSGVNKAVYSGSLSEIQEVAWDELRKMSETTR